MEQHLLCDLPLVSLWRICAQCPHKASFKSSFKPRTWLIALFAKPAKTPANPPSHIMARRRYRLLTLAAVVLVFMLYHVAQNAWDTTAHPFSDTRAPPSSPPPKTAVHPELDLGLDTTASQQQAAGARAPPQVPLEKPNVDAQKRPDAASNKEEESPQRVRVLTPVEGPTSNGAAAASAAKRPDAAPEKEKSSSSSSQKVKVLTPVESPTYNTAADANPATTSKELAADPANKAPPVTSVKPAAASTSSKTKTHWTSLPQDYPVPTESMAALPTGKPKAIPTIQHAFTPESAADKTKREARRAKVKAAISKSWNSYRKNAWMHDELRPISGAFKDPFCGWAATLVDSLDTLWIAGLREEFDDAVQYGVANIDFTFSEKYEIPVFETTIRYLGGLLAAFDVSGGHEGKYPVLLDKAVELAEVLYGVFDTPNRMPVLYYRWQPMHVAQKHKAATVGIAELATLSMEFTRLAQLTKENKYYDAVDRITNALVEFQTEGKAAIPGLFPENLDASGDSLVPSSSYSQSFSMGGSQDSAYEYFPKEYLLLGGLEPKYQKLHEATVSAVDEWLMYRPMINESDWDIYFSAKIRTQGDPSRDLDVQYEASHLTCFLGGMYGLGAKIFDRPQDLATAKRLTDGCVWAYHKTPSGLMPEASLLVPCPSLDKCPFDKAAWYASLDSNKEYRDQQISEWELQYGTVAQSGDSSVPERPQSHEEYVEDYITSMRLPAGFSSVVFRSYILRPEAIESVWYMYRITGDPAWMDKGWAMFEATMAATDTDLANTAVSDVMVEKPPMDDAMESFWIAETLKYYYMLYAGPDVISLDEWVLNTEAHPFRRPT
ncbi:class I alpha-mannosidase [Cordyceps militaris CM01]|uniref:alpha-1,2-Mannosidase n=1 Tax=Cordyceps militaris (strain CM01) TaxID=983644 RepID=G3J448_CORMM|nr:class I alpha-mannosidase [Cordyceps militaris CM01]EGX96619.1 class I alpha-mannosidase [Cordyceps militaris CM01]